MHPATTLPPRELADWTAYRSAMIEEWRPIPSCPGYQASSHGRIMAPTGRVLAQHVLNDRYRRVTIIRPGSRVKRKRLVHRLVCEAFHGPAPTPFHVAAHWNDVGDHNVPSNLRWATQLENMHDLYRLGRWARKERPPARGRFSKLNEVQVYAIHHALAAGATQSALARHMGVGETAIWNIAHGKKWKRLGLVPIGSNLGAPSSAERAVLLALPEKRGAG